MRTENPPSLITCVSPSLTRGVWVGIRVFVGVAVALCVGIGVLVELGIVVGVIVGTAIIGVEQLTANKGKRIRTPNWTTVFIMPTL